MDQCITISGLMMEIVIFLVVCAIIFWNKFSDVKEPFDKERKKFHWKRDFWQYYYDDLFKRWVVGLAGALLAGELGYPFIKPMLEAVMNTSDLADKTINLTLIALCTWYAPKLFVKDK